MTVVSLDSLYSLPSGVWMGTLPVHSVLMNCVCPITADLKSPPPSVAQHGVKLSNISWSTQTKFIYRFLTI